jgi:hypothetical protein
MGSKHGCYLEEINENYVPTRMLSRAQEVLAAYLASLICDIILSKPRRWWKHLTECVAHIDG